ncbi:hypothetical protein Ahia01_001199200, partial [Argonauta hians]
PLLMYNKLLVSFHYSNSVRVFLVDSTIDINQSPSPLPLPYDLLGGIVSKTDSPSQLGWPHHLPCSIKFFGEFGHTFMEFVTNSGDFCQAQHV